MLANVETDLPRRLGRTETALLPCRLEPRWATLWLAANHPGGYGPSGLGGDIGLMGYSVNASQLRDARGWEEPRRIGRPAGWPRSGPNLSRRILSAPSITVNLQFLTNTRSGLIEPRFALLGRHSDGWAEWARHASDS